MINTLNMKVVKNISNLIVMLIVLACFSQCTSSKTVNEEITQEKNSLEFQEIVLFEIKQVQFQKWAAGIQGGGTGYHMYIDVVSNKDHVIFDSIYFRGLQAKIQIGKMNYFATLNSKVNKKTDIEMSNDPNAEYGNKAPNIILKFPFELKDDECAISYIEKEETKYFKIEGLNEKPALNYPSTLPKN